MRYLLIIFGMTLLLSIPTLAQDGGETMPFDTVMLPVQNVRVDSRTERIYATVAYPSDCYKEGTNLKGVKVAKEEDYNYLFITHVALEYDHICPQKITFKEVTFDVSKLKGDFYKIIDGADHEALGWIKF